VGAVRLQNCLIIKCKKRSRQRESERGREDRVGGGDTESERETEIKFLLKDTHGL